VNGRAILHALGRLMQLMAAFLLIPLGIAVWEARDWSPLTRPQGYAFIITVAVALVAGTILQFTCRAARDEQRTREGFAIVTLGWALLALLGSIPFFVYFLATRDVSAPHQIFTAFTDAYFEIMSGFTTTGATILTNIEGLPRDLLFWRSLTHWLGGMGIITLALAIFPAMGIAGYQMFRGEVPGPSADRLRPRLAETAKVLWGVYLLLSAAQTTLLMLGGMDLFDALCHTFGTMATGGFSTRSASIGAYQSAYIEWVVILFMFLAGTNFLLHYRVLFRRDWLAVRNNREFHFYAGTVLVAILITMAVLHFDGVPAAEISEQHYQFDSRPTVAHATHVAAEQEKLSSFDGLLRHSAFQVVAITTTTGYGTADFDVWPRSIGLLLVVLMFWGGCAGSTGGGMKMIRILVVLKVAWRELRRMVRPRLIAPLKVRGYTVEEKRIANVVGFFILFVALFIVCSIIMTLFIPDLTTAVTAVAATIANIGPGLSGVGSTQTYAWIPTAGKWVLILCMLLGRLEIFTVIVLLRPSFWKR